ncbi:hypothetical protein BGW37DRAFT_235102 [Umbelopsis sp. PMI_123]|nr:hypothetical protein BGW37DRAFT_235102 [Umbelopsis sp. PMI_123]
MCNELYSNFLASLSTWSIMLTVAVSEALVSMEPDAVHTDNESKSTSTLTREAYFLVLLQRFYRWLQCLSCSLMDSV